MKTYNDILDKIRCAKRIAIFAHKEPDPDALGACFGLKGLCKDMEINADVFMICENDSKIFDCFPMNEAKTEFNKKDYDLVAWVDMHSFDRLAPQFEEVLKDFDNFVIVDHHVLVEDETLITENCVVEQKASASQMIFELYKTAGLLPNEEVATYIYAGLMGDTNRFLNSNVGEEEFSVAKELLGCRADIQQVYDNMYRSTTKNQINVLKAIYNNIRYIHDGKVACVIFTNKDMKKLGVSVEDVKSHSNTLIRIDGVCVSFLIYESRKNLFKCSMRSAGFDLVPFATKMGGGGHHPAAAFEVEARKSYIQRHIKAWAEEILNG